LEKERFVTLLPSSEMEDIKSAIKKRDLYPLSKGYKEIVRLGFKEFQKQKPGGKNEQQRSKTG